MLRALIVDDEPLILEGLTHIVNWSHFGIEISGLCANGAEAVQILKSQTVDILITDIKMPEMNGIELIRYIKHMSLNTRCIVLSSYDDFQFIKEASLLGIENYLLKPVSTIELISTLENIVSKIESQLFQQIERHQEKHVLRNNVIYRWVTDDIDKKELETRASLLEINLLNESYLVAMIKIVYDDKKTDSYKIKDKKLLRFAANNICSELVDQLSNGMTVIDMNGDIVLLLYQETGEIPHTIIDKIMRNCINHLNTLLRIDVFVTVGTLQTSYKQVPISYVQAKTIQEFQLLYAYNTILYYEETAPFLKLDVALPRIDFKQLREVFTSRNKASVSAFYEGVSDLLRDKRYFSPIYIKNAILELVFQITAIVSELSPNSEAFFDKNRDSFQHIYQIDTIQSMLLSLQQVTLKAIDYLIERDEQISPFIRRIVSYLQTHYADDIDLKQVAHEYKINPMYLGQCFKKEIGDSFTLYFNKIRVEKAKDLLLHTTMKTNEIAEKVGYTNVNYFPTIFKKLVGLSPSDYQKSYIDGELAK